MKFSATIVSTLFGCATAHFLLDYPPTRGFDEDNEPTAICGGFDTIKNRTAFPLGPAQIEISSFHVTASVFAEISFDSNPTSFTQFNTSSNGTTYPQLVGFNQIPEGPACYNVNVGGLGVSDAKNGTNATLVVIFDGGDGTLYQCADLVLIEGATVPSGSILSNITCKSVAANSSSGTNSSSSGKSAAVKPVPAAGLSVGLLALSGLFAIVVTVGF